MNIFTIHSRPRRYHILQQIGSILGDIVSENKQLTGSVTNGIYNPLSYIIILVRRLSVCVCLFENPSKIIGRIDFILRGNTNLISEGNL